jgi:hypothetical protein
VLKDIVSGKTSGEFVKPLNKLAHKLFPKNSGQKLPSLKGKPSPDRKVKGHIIYFFSIITKIIYFIFYSFIKES